MWKNVYSDFLLENLDSPLQEETLKDKLREASKEVKMGTSNKPNSDMANLQGEDVLAWLKQTDGHNVLKRRQSLREQCSPTYSTSTTTDASDSTQGPLCKIVCFISYEK